MSSPYPDGQMGCKGSPASHVHSLPTRSLGRRGSFLGWEGQRPAHPPAADTPGGREAATLFKEHSSWNKLSALI